MSKNTKDRKNIPNAGEEATVLGQGDLLGDQSGDPVNSQPGDNIIDPAGVSANDVSVNDTGVTGELDTKADELNPQDITADATAIPNTSSVDNTGDDNDKTDEDNEDESTDAYQGEIPVVEGWSDVKKIMTLNTTFENKLEMLSRCGFKPVELFVGFFIDYGNVMGANVNEQEGAKNNTRLYNNLLTVLREQDDAVFKTKFDVINLIFKNGAKEAFNEFRLCRFSDIQKVSEKQLTTYHRLVVLIYSLADAATRAVNKKPLAGFSGSNTELTTDDISRLKRYYGL